MVGGDTGEGGEHPVKYSRCFAFSDRLTGGESCVFAMLGMCGRRTDCVFGFVSSF